MPIINRNFDVTERRMSFYETYGASGFPITTGITLPIAIIPMNGIISSFYMAVSGVSNTPSYAFNLLRFIAGTGFTTIGVTNCTLTPLNFGTSGCVYTGPSYIVGNATYLVAGQTVLSGDLLVMTTGGANGAAQFMTIGANIQATDDYVKYLGT